MNALVIGSTVLLLCLCMIGMSEHSCLLRYVHYSMHTRTLSSDKGIAGGRKASGWEKKEQEELERGKQGFPIITPFLPSSVSLTGKPISFKVKRA